jgi:phosphohistidine phosphatase
MHIYLVRHAAAVPRGEAIVDHARPLSPDGRKRFERAVKGLDRLGVRFERIYHSPWVRARQTAELMKPLLDGDFIETTELATTPGVKLLEQLAGERIAVVGHEPWMGELCALLLLGDTASGMLFPFKKGGVAHLEGVPAPAGCTLTEMLTPKLLRAVK